MSTLAQNKMIRARVSSDTLNAVKRLCLDRNTTIQEWLSALIVRGLESSKSQRPQYKVSK